MKFSVYYWVIVICIAIVSIVSFVYAQKTVISRHNTNAVHGFQRTPTALSSNNENTDEYFVSSASVYSAERIVRGIARNSVNPTKIALGVPIAIANTKNLITYPYESNGRTQNSVVRGITPTIVPNSGTLVYYPSQDAVAAAGYDELFQVSPDDNPYSSIIFRPSFTTSGRYWELLTGTQNVIGITSYARMLPKIQYLNGANLPCTTIGQGDSIFTNNASNCTKIQNITQIINNFYGIDGGFVLTSSGKVIDFKAARTNLPTNAVKLAGSNPCAVALKSDKSIVVLNKSGVDLSDYKYGDMRCYGLSALFSGHQYKDVSGYRMTDFHYCENCEIVATVNQMQFTTVDTAGEVVNYAYDGDTQTWGTTVVYSPADDNLPNMAVGIPDDNTNAVLRLNDGSIIYAQTPQVNDVACTIPNDIHDVVQLEIVNSYDNYQDILTNNQTPALIKIAYALRNDNTLWRWKLPTTDTCYDSVEQLGTGIKQFAATGMGVTAIKTTFATDDLTIQVQPIANATLFTNSKNCGIYVYANGGVKSTALSAWNGIAYQWYYGVSGDTSQPVTGAASPVLCTYQITDAGPYWVQIKDANTTLNSNTVDVSWLDVDTNHIAGSMVAWGDHSTQINAAAKSWRNVIKAGYWFVQHNDGARTNYYKWGSDNTWQPWYSSIGWGDVDLWRDVLDTTYSSVRLTSDYHIVDFVPGANEYSSGSSTCDAACQAEQFKTIDVSDHWQDGTKSYHLMGITIDNRVIDSYLGDTLETNTITYTDVLTPVVAVALKVTSGSAGAGIGTHDGLVLFDDGNWDSQQTGIVKQYRDGSEITDNTATLGQVKKIVAGGYHYMALQSDGSVVAWMALSDPTYDKGQATIPTTLTCAKDIAAGEYFSVALTCSGKVVQWGNQPATVPALTVPALLANASGGTVRAVFARGDRAFAIVNPEVIATSTATRTNTCTATNTRTATNTSTNTPTRSNTPTSTNTRTATNTATPSNTRTNTPTRTNTLTRTNTQTATNTSTSTNTRTATNTRTNTATRTNTSTRTNTRTASNTATRTNTRTATNTRTNTPTRTPK